MKKSPVILFLFFFCSLFVYAQRPFKGQFINEELKIRMKLNLYNDSIPVPGLELDSCFGFFQGSINGTWAILKVIKIEDNRAEVRAVSDRGSDAQTLELTLTDKGLGVRQLNDSNMKGVAGRKYVKLPKIFYFKNDR